MVTVFIPSSPTAFSGYVVVVPREEALELPMTVEEALKLLVTGGVSAPLLDLKSGAAGVRGQQRPPVEKEALKPPVGGVLPE